MFLFNKQCHHGRWGTSYPWGTGRDREPHTHGGQDMTGDLVHMGDQVVMGHLVHMEDQVMTGDLEHMGDRS